MGRAPPIGPPGASCGPWQPLWQRSRTSPRPRFQNPSIAGWDCVPAFWDRRRPGTGRRAHVGDRPRAGALTTFPRQNAGHRHASMGAPPAAGPPAADSPATRQPRPPPTFPRQIPGHRHARLGARAMMSSIEPAHPPTRPPVHPAAVHPPRQRPRPHPCPLRNCADHPHVTSGLGADRQSLAIGPSWPRTG